MKIKAILLLILVSSNAISAVSYSEFLVLKWAVSEAYKEIQTSEEEQLSINTIYDGMSPTMWWDTPMVHASYVYTDLENGPTHNIYLMGGFAKQEFMTPDGLALTACHEIGHGIGGEPHKINEDGSHDHFSSTEGQSDYYSTKSCLSYVFKFLPEFREIPENKYHKILCEKQSKHDIKLCLRMMNALNSKVNYLNSILKDGEKPVSFDSYSRHTQAELDFSPRYYPDPQCRLDTQINGILGLERPECWYPGGEKNGTLR